MVQATKNKEESCSFLDAIGRRSCGPLSGLAKNRHVGSPSFDSSGSRQLVGTLRCALSLSSDLHFNSRSSLACLSSACISLGMLLKAKFTPAVSSVQSLTPPPLSLSLSPFDQIREKESLPLNMAISESTLNVPGPRSRSPGLPQLSMLYKKKSRALSCNVKLCFVNLEQNSDSVWVSLAALGSCQLHFDNVS